MTLTAEGVTVALAPRPVRFYSQVGSTNDVALEWLSQGAPSGAVVLADEQIGGRGRLGRSWYTPPGTALIVSVILRPTAPVLSQLTMLGALAIYDLLTTIGVEDISIKWPNDVQVHGRKVSGILPEVLWNGSHLAGVVLGMGINVRIDFSGTELENHAISIEPVLGRPVDRIALLSDLLVQVDKWYACLGTFDLFETWQNRLITIGQSVQLKKDGQMIAGIADSVDSSGALIVVDAKGKPNRILAGDVNLGTTG
ncbi:MAG: biotin--[acetyl-CoA-carboxylase] ligase [Anaerolineae bacterium]